MRLLLLLFMVPYIVGQQQWVPCSELNDDLRYPCRCKVQVDRSLQLRILMNCDRVVFNGDFPTLPYGAPIISFSQRFAGQQALPTQIFSSYSLPLQELDFSHNSLRRLPDRLLAAVRGNITKLVFSDNLLGDNLNPIFSTAELHNLPALEELDLSGNRIRGLQEGLLIGCDVLRVLRLDRNNINNVPSSSLNGPLALKVLSLKENRIALIRQRTFTSQKTLEEIDLHGNMISSIEGGAFADLKDLQALDLGRNRLSKFNSDVFQGAENLEKLDLSENFITDFPTVAMKSFKALKHLNISSNMITNIDNSHLSSLVSLQVLDLSRNNLVKLSPGTFVGLTELKYLDVGVNALRTVEDDAFDGLVNLETLLLRDNNILLIPATALSRLPNLVSVHLGYNRVTALSNDILKAVSDRVTSLVLSRNVIRELPAAVFDHFANLNHLDLSGNLLNYISAEVFSGLEQSLQFLSLSQNKILEFGREPLKFISLWFLDFSDNQISEIPVDAFQFIPSLVHLNLSRNSHISTLPQTLFQNNQALMTIDLSQVSLKALPVNLFSKNSNLKEIYLSHNLLQEISENTFKNLRNLTYLDLSYNNIVNIRTPAFVNVMSIQYLSLKGNQLNAFKGEFFNTGTSLEVIDLSDNQLSYLFPSSFKIHPRLREIILMNNKFNFFPSELISTLQYLELVDLSGNTLKNVDELDFARLPKLRTVLLARNELESISEMAFHNSTQIQHLDLSSNKIDRLGDRLFEGLIRLEVLNLGENLLTELPDNIFERSRIHMLEKIILSKNLFEHAPLKALQKQYFFVSSVDLSHNQIIDIPAEDSVMVNIKKLDLSFNPLSEKKISNVLTEPKTVQKQYFFVSSVDLSHNQIIDIPAEDSVMVNIKKLDLSFNPLSEKTISNVLTEPKTVRELNLAGTGIKTIGQLETPFLQNLNLSFNNITRVSDKTFTRTTLLESLDLSENQISDVSGSLTMSWPKLKNLLWLNISGNPMVMIMENNFEGLASLQVLDMGNLEKCTRIEKNAFRALPNLVELRAYGYPRLGYFDVQGALQFLLALEKLDVEVKDTTIGADQLHTILHPRLEELGLRGSRLKTVSSGVLAGLKAPAITVKFRNTSVTSLPPALLFPLPRSSQITIDVGGSHLTTLQPQLLVALDDRRADLSMFGLDTNPIRCDCNARALRRWLPNVGVMDVKCDSPEHLSGFLLVEIGDDELTCETKRRTTPTSTSISTTPTPRIVRTSSEPDIIWSVAPAHDRPKATGEPKGAPVVGLSTTSNDDNLIIGIVGGVVAFIAILIVVICIVRLRMSSNSYRGGPLASSPTAGGPPMWGPPWPGYAGTMPPPSLSNATLPHKVQSGPGSVRYIAAPPPAPYFISMPPHDEKIYR